MSSLFQLEQQSPSACTCCPVHTGTQAKQLIVDTKHPSRNILEQNFVEISGIQVVRNTRVTRHFARTALELPNLNMSGVDISGLSLYKVAVLYVYLELNRKNDGGFQTPNHEECRDIMKKWKLQSWVNEIGWYVEFDEGSWQQVVHIADKFHMVEVP